MIDIIAGIIVGGFLGMKFVEQILNYFGPGKEYVVVCIVILVIITLAYGITR